MRDGASVSSQSEGQCMIHRVFHSLILLLLFAGHSACGETELWRLTFNSNWLGPVEAHFDVTMDGDNVAAVSRSGAVELLKVQPGDHDLSDGLAAFTAARTDDGSYKGNFTAPWQEGEITIAFDNDAARGNVQGGAFNGELTGTRVESAGRLRDYPAILRSLDEVVAAKVFEPARLQEPSYIAFRSRLGAIAEIAQDDLDFLFGFHWSWNNDPFSHFQLKRSTQSAEQLFAFFDNYRVGFEAATVRFDGETAILKVATMMGADTIEQIEAAYDAIDTGYFLSQRWHDDHDALPTKEQVLETEPWQGWSILSFWQDVQERGLLRLRFQPDEPHFHGDVYVLLDKVSASATELAADALRTAGATLIGEVTAGEMLSQSMFDLPDGYSLSLPVADYYSLEHGRIEGAGVPVGVETKDAMAEALKIISVQ